MRVRVVVAAAAEVELLGSSELLKQGFWDLQGDSELWEQGFWDLQGGSDLWE